MCAGTRSVRRRRRDSNKKKIDSRTITERVQTTDTPSGVENARAHNERRPWFESTLIFFETHGGCSCQSLVLSM
jgi:hypothetical protein